MSEGWIKLNRKLLRSPCFKNRELLQLWIWLLLTVNHDEGKVMVGNQIVNVLPGQTVTGRNKIESETGLNRSKIERLLKILKSEQQIEQQTFTKYRIISITNWRLYQESEQQNEQQVSNKRATSEHKQEGKEGKECKEVKEERVIEPDLGDKSPPPSTLKDLWNEVVKMPFVKEFTKARTVKCRLRLQERTPEEWRLVFQKVKDSPFCQGDNDRGWRADFDWIMKNQENSARVLEGKYDKKHFNGVIQASKGAAGGLARIAEMQREKLEREARENAQPS